MKLALSIYRYFPHGGLQRDFRAFLTELSRRGHRCRVYTGEWQGEPPEGVELHLIPRRGLSNHARDGHFQRQVAAALAREPADAHIGFNKMPGLDICFVGDGCFLARADNARGPLYRMGGRYRHHVASERAVFAPEAATHILLLNDVQKRAYTGCYQTPEARLHVLPPGVAPERRAPGVSQPRRRELREQMGLAEGEYTLLFVAGQFHTKGLDRVIAALAHVKEQQPDLATRLLVAGGGKSREFARQARALGVQERIDFLGARDDVLDLMLAADVLVHPAREEAGGVVLLEAIAAGLPVIATDTCGYANHIIAARCGRVLPAPLEQDALNAGVLRFIDGVLRADCRESALLYARLEDLYSMHSAGADLIETLLQTPGAARG